MLCIKDLHCDFLSKEKNGRKTPKKKYKLLCQEIGICGMGFLMYITTSETFYEGKRGWHTIKPCDWLKSNSDSRFQAVFQLKSFINVRYPCYHTQTDISNMLADPNNGFPYVTTISQDEYEKLLLEGKEYIADELPVSEFSGLVDERKLSKKILNAIKSL